MKKIFKHIIAISIITVILIILLEFIIMPFYVRHGKSKELIDVTLMDIKSAMIMIKTSGFKGIVTDTIYTSEVEPNLVLDQHPEPGTIVKKGRTVRLKISQTEKLVLVPNIIGQSQRSAELLLNKVGLKISAISREYSVIVPNGVIVNQMPDSTETLPKGYSVRVIISKGRSPNDIQVPSLFGLSKEAAELELQRIGLGIGKVHYKQNEDLIPYTVLDQSIQAGTILENSQSIDITVSVLDLQDIFEQMTD
ncbi:MAG: PASTA domain-containing protein [Candidatus Neomarinimicrobiota bacterium]